MKEFEKAIAPLWLFRSPVWRVFLLPDDLAAYRRTMKEIHEATARPYPEARQALEALDQSLRRNRCGLLTSLIVPYLNNCVRSAAETDSARQLVRLAVAVLAYRSQNGKEPEKLDGLVPDYLDRVPLDPFDGQPLRLKRGEKGLVLYSVGGDLKDDDGIPWEAAKQEGDLVFRLR